MPLYIKMFFSALFWATNHNKLLNFKSHTSSPMTGFVISAVLWAGLGWMSLQFGFFARLTWWDYSWDIMEPVTYFVGYGTSVLIFAYFILTRQVMQGFIWRFYFGGETCLLGGGGNIPWSPPQIKPWMMALLQHSCH